jgi:hypothetical protein
MEPLPSARPTGTRQRDLPWATTPFYMPSVQDDNQQRNSLCRVPVPQELDKGSSRGPKAQSLGQVYNLALNKGFFFAECHDHNTRQRSFTGSQVCLLSWVLWSLFSAKWLEIHHFICFFIPSKQNTRYISLKSHISPAPHISQRAQSSQVFHKQHVFLG